MARDLPCDMCGETTADFMVTMIHNGDTISLGAECVSAWAEAITTALDAAASREPDAAEDRPVEAVAGPDDWEGGYPQGRDSGDPGAADGPEEAVGADTEAAAATNGDG